MKYLLLVILLTGCATTATKFEYPNGVKTPVEQYKLSGFGKIKVTPESYELERKPFFELPSVDLNND